MGECGVLVHNSCRSPNGRKGGTAHQQEIQDIKDAINDRGNKFTVREKMYDTTGGHKNRRFADVTELDGDGQVVAIYQVGKVNKNGTPVARERRAIEDIMNSEEYINSPVPIYFVPYNPNNNATGPIKYE